MSWDAVTALVDTLGLIVIVLSLVYISRQTKQANEHAASESEIEFLNGVSRIFNEWSSDEHTAGVIRKGFARFDDLTNSEQAVFDGRVGALLNHMLLGNQLSKRGQLSSEIAEEVRKIVLSVLCTEGGYRYLELAANVFPGGPELLEESESVRGEHPAITDLMPWWRES